MIFKLKLFPGNKHSYIAVAAANILCFIVGNTSGWSSPILPKLQKEGNPLGRIISSDEYSWIGSLLPMGGVVSPLIWSFAVPRMGRKQAGLLAVVPFLVAYLISAFCEKIELFYFARVLMGIGTGGMFCVTPIYVVEVAEDVNRGLLASSTGSFLVAGILFVYCIGPYVSIMTFNLILAGICVLYAISFYFLSPETPYYYVKKHDEEKALESLFYLRRLPRQELQNELSQIKTYLESYTSASFTRIFKSKASIKATIYSLALIIFQQFSGINVLFYYMQDIFEATHSTLSAEISSMIVGAAQLCASCIASFSSDKAGRRVLLLISITGATLALVSLGVYFYLLENGNNVSDIYWLPLVSMVVFILFYNFGMGSLPWAIIPEILPSNIISNAFLIITFVYWLVGWAIAQYSAEFILAVSGAGSFWFFAGCCGLFGLFVYFFIFETKGKSLQEIQEILSG